MNIEIISGNMLDHQLDLALQEALRKLEANGQEGPPSHLWEDDKAFHVELSVPGWQPHQMTLEVDNDMLTVQGERSRSSRNFVRQVRLPASVTTEKARAAYCKDVLTISFRKRPESRARRILVEVA